jgi:GT2 family glycosyltransferase
VTRLAAVEQRPGIDVVIPVYNKLPFIAPAVGSIVAAAEAYGAARVWLVDNGSTDGSYELLVREFGERASVLRLMSCTIAAVRNFGASHGGAPIISFIDCDCVVQPDYFTRLEAVLSETGAEGTGCAVVLPPNPTWVEAVWNRMHDDGAIGTRQWINSANFATRRTMFESIGGFNETCVTDEDTEICLRIRRAGGRLLSDSRLAAAHLDNAKTLPAFFRKERWRAQGMFSTLSIASVDRASVMMTAHLCALLIAAAVMFLAPTAIWVRAVVAIGLTLVVPATTAVYRRRSSVQAFSLTLAITLYEVFYLARINALIILAARAVRRSVKAEGGSATTQP